MNAALVASPRIGVLRACEAIGVARATFYRRRNCRANEPQTTALERQPPARALTLAERNKALELLTSQRFCDSSPSQVYATLLDEREYLCSISTLYRLLRAAGAVRERRDQLRHPVYSKPELLATEPNQVWSWDITKLLGPAKWTYFYLYVILDIFSRYVVGWMVAHQESAALASQLIGETYAKQGIEPGHLTVHADRGSSMKSKLVAHLLGDLGVTKTHSRPHVSNDNCFSESLFKSLKYRPEFPDRFGSIQDARCFSRAFFHWYNKEHHHSGIALHTPQNVHYGLTEALNEERRQTLLHAFAHHPERFVRKLPEPPLLPEAVWINPPKLTGREPETDPALH